ncbi:ataxin-10 [Sitophilus oryzae]|uniref:Ataxin-10 n=1 Tax=Sitophilus oryzae TaxID=7048 RepID=A0A6J2XBM6_SITOR|nr:ataxin-10 [Sitophilus oryzae]
MDPSTSYFAYSIQEIFNQNNFNELNNSLKCYYKTYLLNKEDFIISSEDVDCLLNIVTYINTRFGWYNNLEVPFPQVLTETIKILRVFVTKKWIAQYVIENAKFFSVFSFLMTCVFTKKNGQELYTKYLLQMIVNLLCIGKESDCGEFHSKVFINFSYQLNNFFRECYGFSYEISAVIYNLFLNKEIRDLKLINSVIENYGNCTTSNEYLDFLLNQICCQNFIWASYETLPLKSRLILLNYLNELLVSTNANLKQKLSNSSLERLLQVFNDSSNVVFQVSQAGCAESSQEVSYVLQLISVLSANENYINILQSNVAMFINAGVLLVNIHRLGKSSENVFKPIQKLSEINNPSQEIWNNPVYGFKASLIRLIGNLCWKNKRLQDLARTAEVIPILLDCCNIDARNPFIMQWVILAIRNICENNKTNQAIIEGLTQQGMVQSEILQELGISSNNQDNLIEKFVNIDLNRSDGNK